MQLVTLGGLKLDGASFARVKPLLLLTYVALEGSRDRHHLAELFWLDAADPLNSLSAALKQLRQYAPGALEADHTHVTSAVECDASTFLQVADAGPYEQALKLYQGPFLSGVYLPSWNAELEEWVYGTREFLAGRARNAWLRSGEDIAANGKFEEAAKCAEVAYLLLGAPELEPEELMRLYTLLAAGNSPHLGSLRKDARGFGIELSISTAAARGQLWHPPGSLSLGILRQRLPTRGTSFIGRDIELAEIANQLDKPDCSLLTLTGPGGVGKSRLAVHVAHNLSERYLDGVYFIPLEALSADNLIPPSIAGVLGLSLQGGEDPLVQVARHVGDKTMLLVLDNYEHLLEGATLVARLLHACPNLKLLVTSRERLNLEEEWVIPLEGLAVPTKDLPSAEASYHDAIDLFVERAKRARLSFELNEEELPYVVSICKQVNGLPLGIELAAAWVKLLSCKEIAQEIERTTDFLSATGRNVPERHKSIRAVFEHSWRLLTPKVQKVLRKLSVFQGGFRREAAASVAGATIPALASLVDKSLLSITGGSRYNLHPLMHQYVLEKLAACPKEKGQVQGTFSTYFFQKLNRWSADLQGPKRSVMLKAFEEEVNNVRAAWRWAVAEAKAPELKEAVQVLASFYIERALFQEGMEVLGQAVEGLDEAEPTHRSALGNILLDQAHFYHQLGYHQQAIHVAQRGLDLLRPLGDRQGVGKGLNMLGHLLAYTGDFGYAKLHHEEALVVAEAHGDSAGIATSLSDLGNAERALGNYTNAERCYRESLRINRQLGDGAAITHALNNLAALKLNLGRSREAQPFLQEALQLARDMGMRYDLPVLLLNLADVFYELGDYPQAQALSQESRSLLEEVGDMVILPETLQMLGRIAVALADYPQAYAYTVRSLKMAWSARGLPIVLQGLFCLAELQIKQGQTQEAVVLLSLITHHPSTAQHIHGLAEGWLNALRPQVSSKEMAEALERGKSAQLEVVLEETLRLFNSQVQPNL